MSGSETGSGARRSTEKSQPLIACAVEQIAICGLVKVLACRQCSSFGLAAASTEYPLTAARHLHKREQ